MGGIRPGGQPAVSLPGPRRDNCALVHNRPWPPPTGPSSLLRLWAGGVLAAAVVAMAVACGGGDDKSAGCGASGPGGTAIPPGAPCIDQDRLKFTPGALTVTTGKTVYFLNSESAFHTVTINGRNESGDMKKGAVFAWTPPAPGTYRVTCDVHPQMRATITVN